MKQFKSINPFNGEILNHFPLISRDEAIKRVEKNHIAFNDFQKVSYNERSHKLEKLSELLKTNKAELALTMTQEMGKPISQAIAEVEKCAWVCNYYAENGDDFLSDDTIKTDASNSFVRHEPLGSILAIMPWNFPYWQFFRFAAPNIMAGNSLLLKHAPNVQGCAEHIIELFKAADFDPDFCQNLAVDVSDVESIIEHKAVQGVTLTGSTRAGSAVASIAGKNIKKTVLELGGSNPFIVMEDADLDLALEKAWNGRMQNTGQSCIAAKRFLVHEKHVDDFIDGFLSKLMGAQVENPEDDDSFFGPMARTDLAEELESQMKKSVEMGAQLIHGGNRTDAHFQPALLAGVKPGMPAFDEETFGPLALVTTFKIEEEALELANQTDYGLGASVISKNPEQHIHLLRKIQGGAVFFNEIVKSDPRLPFGGTHKSGYGRELAKEGILEFTNQKVIYFA
jgi:succinate-semialdehyde dehydrogenase/glutarate-semialdehyde dehydrogenase